MFMLRIENERGQQLSLNPSDRYVVTQVEGLTPPSANIATTPMVNLDGARFNTSKMGMRNLVIYLEPNFPIEENRILIYEYVKPKRWVKVYYKNGLRNVYIEGYVEGVTANLFTRKQEIQISILCPNPYWKSIAEVVSDISQVSALLEFPYSSDEVGQPVSEINQYLVAAVQNTGSVETGAIIEMDAVGGDVSRPKIVNADTGEVMEFKFTMLAGSRMIINTNPGQKSITYVTPGGNSYSNIEMLTSESSWFKIPFGTSFFTYSANSGQENLFVKFKVQALYEGV